MTDQVKPSQKDQNIDDSELTPSERQELRELLTALRFEKKLAERNLKRLAAIRVGAGWLTGVLIAMYALRDLFAGIFQFVVAGYKGVGGGN